MSAMKTINVDADQKNADWPKRTKDVTDYPLVPAKSSSVGKAFKAAKKK